MQLHTYLTCEYPLCKQTKSIGTVPDTSPVRLHYLVELVPRRQPVEPVKHPGRELLWITSYSLRETAGQDGEG